MILRDLEKFKSHLRNGTYSDECLSGVFLLLIKEFALLEERLEKVLGRLRAIPDVLARGKENITPQEVPPVWNEMALESSQQGLALFTVLIPALAQQAPKLAAALNTASQSAARAFEDYARFLKETVGPKARGNFAAGKQLFEELVHENHMLDYSDEDVLSIGWKLFKETDKVMAELSQRIDRGKTARELLEQAKAERD